MVPVTEKKINEMAAAIVREVHPEKVILFGSRARPCRCGFSLGRRILVVVEEKGSFGPGRSRRKEMARLCKTISRFGLPTDILVYSQEEFDYCSESLNYVVGRAVREGRTLPERTLGPHASLSPGPWWIWRP